MTPQSSKAPWVLDFFLLAAIWGSSFLFTHIAAREFGPFPTAGLRVGVGALFLLPLLLARGQGAALGQHWKPGFIVGMLNSGIPFACYSFALLSISSGLSSILNATAPLFGALVAWAWLGERPTRLRVLGLGIGFLGVALLAAQKAQFHGDAASGWAVLACLGACLCYGLAASFTRRYLSGVPAIVTATGSQVGAALGLLPLVYWFWPQRAPSLAAWGAVAMLGVLCTGVAYVLYYRLIERAGPAKALSVTFCIPAFAVLYGVLFLGEEVTPWMLLCALIIIAGTALSTGLLPRKR